LQITQKIFRVATFFNGQSGAGNKQFLNFGLRPLPSEAVLIRPDFRCTKIIKYY
jgi:hypothetical protein